MSPHDSGHPADHHAHAGHDGHADGHPHVSRRDYVTGFVLSVILTAIPFWLVMSKAIPNPAVASLVILAFAAVQVVVHMVYFLHMSPKSEGGWNLLALVFTVVLVVILLAGSLWVMHHLNTNMMPTSTHDMRTMP